MNRSGNRNKLIKNKGSFFGFVLLDYSPKGKVLKASKEFYNIIGYSAKEFAEKHNSLLSNLMTEEDNRYALEKIRHQLETFSDIDLEINITKKDMSTAYLYIAGQVKTRFFGKRLFCVVVDVSYSHMANRQLLKINMDLDRFVSNLPGGAYRFLHGGKGEFDFISRGMYELCSFERAVFKEKTQNMYINIINPDDRDRVTSEIEKQIDENGTYDVEYRITVNNDIVKWVADRGQIVPDSNGDVWVCGIVTDITESKKQQLELEISRERYHVISELLEDIIFDYNIDNSKITFSSRFLARFNCPKVIDDSAEFLKTSPIIFDEHRELLKKQFNDIKEGIDKASSEVLLKEEKGGFKWYTVHTAIIYDDEHMPIGAVGKITCIHEQKEELKRLIERANLDALTGLFNKSAVKTEIEGKLSQLAKGKEKCALMIIDIDNFKAVNDNQGHLFGDAILSELSSNLMEAFPDDAILGRIGGDEFIMFAYGFKTLPSLKKIADKLCKILSLSHTGEEKSYLISGSVGIAVYPENGLTYDELFKNADIALYSAKNKGKNRYEMYNGNAKSTMGTIVIDLNNEYQKLCTSAGVNSSIESSMLSYMFAYVNKSGDMRQTVNNMLGIIAEHYRFERICLFGKSPNDELSLELIYEWNDDDVLPLKEKFSVIKLKSMVKFKKLFDENGVYESNDLSDMPVNTGFKSFLKLRENKTTLQLGSYEETELCGYVLVVKEKSEWTIDEKDTIFTLRKLMCQFISKLAIHYTIVNQNKYYNTLTEKQGVGFYTINPVSMELLSLDKNTSKLFSDCTVGKKCFEAFWGKNEMCKGCPTKSLDKNSYAVSEIYSDKLAAWFSISAYKSIGESGKEVYSMSCSNVTEVIERINTRDSLTGLPSISDFTEKAKKLLKSYPDKNYAIICMDIDKFKYINETLGSDAADKILISIAYVLSSLYYYDELVCRSTADKFIMLLRYTDLTNFNKRLTIINQKLFEMQQNDYKNIKITVISGIYLVAGDDRSNISFMIDKASVARRVVKGSHKNDYRIYDEQLHNLVTKEKDIESKMQNALDNREFEVYLQPKKNLADNTIFGAEALVRWRANDGTIILPDEFIPLFEKNGFVVEVDFYVYEEVFKTIRRWIDEGKSAVVVSVNVSRLHLINKEFIPKIKKLIERYLVPPRLIELELTESIFVDYGDYLFDTISKLKSIGFSISIDDFGSGYSSLNLLKDLPVDVIKLDKSFFPNNTIDDKEKIVVSNIVKLAKDLCIKVIAEGVETKEHADYLKEIGCEMAQGYLFGRPVPISEFEALLN